MKQLVITVFLFARNLHLLCKTFLLLHVSGQVWGKLKKFFLLVFYLILTVMYAYHVKESFEQLFSNNPEKAQEQKTKEVTMKKQETEQSKPETERNQHNQPASFSP